MNSKPADLSILSKFPLLQHQWQIVESFKLHITQKSRERLLPLDQNHSPSASPPTPLLLLPLLTSFTPDKLSLFLDSRKSCISQILSNCSSCKTMSFNMINGFWEVLKIIQDTLGQVGELFLLLSDKTLLYKVILGSPSASQLFGSIPDPDEEVKLWKLFRDNLEFKMVTLERDYVAKICSTWLKTCGDEVVNKINGKYLVDSISTGKELASAEKLVRETMDDKQVLAGILDWLKCVIGFEVELPWNRIRELFLAENADLWNEIFEDVFVQRMKTIIDYSYDDLISIINVKKDIIGIVEGFDERADLGGGVWFFEHNKKGDNDLVSCLTAYFGVEVEGIQDAVDNCCHTILEDLLSFLDSPNASVRLDILVSYLQNKCYQSISSILMELKNELDRMSASWENDSVLSLYNCREVVIHWADYVCISKTHSDNTWLTKAMVY